MEAGFTCLIHRDTKQVVSYIGEDKYPDVDPDDWKLQMDINRKKTSSFVFKILILLKVLKSWRNLSIPLRTIQQK